MGTFEAWLGSPYPTLAVGLVLIVAGQRLADNYANATLLAAWCLFAYSAFRLPGLSGLDPIPRALAVMTVAGMVGLGLYYTLWTPRQNLRQPKDRWTATHKITDGDVTLSVSLTPGSNMGEMRITCLLAAPDGHYVASGYSGAGTTIGVSVSYPTMFADAPQSLSAGHYEVVWIMEAEAGTSERRDVIARDSFNIRVSG